MLYHGGFLLRCQNNYRTECGYYGYWGRDRFQGDRLEMLGPLTSCMEDPENLDDLLFDSIGHDIPGEYQFSGSRDPSGPSGGRMVFESLHGFHHFVHFAGGSLRVVLRDIRMEVRQILYGAGQPTDPHAVLRLLAVSFLSVVCTSSWS